MARGGRAGSRAGHFSGRSTGEASEPPSHERSLPKLLRTRLLPPAQPAALGRGSERAALGGDGRTQLIHLTAFPGGKTHFMVAASQPAPWPPAPPAAGQEHVLPSAARVSPCGSLGSVSRAHLAKHCLHKADGSGRRDPPVRAVWNSTQVMVLDIPPKNAFWAGSHQSKLHSQTNQIKRKQQAGAEETPNLCLRERDDQKYLCSSHLRLLLLQAAKTRTSIYAPKPAHRLPSSQSHTAHTDTSSI